MVAGGERMGEAIKVGRRKALLDEETTSTNAPPLVYCDHDDEAENGPLIVQAALGDAMDNTVYDGINTVCRSREHSSPHQISLTSCFATTRPGS